MAETFEKNDILVCTASVQTRQFNVNKQYKVYEDGSILYVWDDTGTRRCINDYQSMLGAVVFLIVERKGCGFYDKRFPGFYRNDFSDLVIGTPVTARYSMPPINLSSQATGIKAGEKYTVKSLDTAALDGRQVHLGDMIPGWFPLYAFKTETTTPKPEPTSVVMSDGMQPYEDLIVSMNSITLHKLNEECKEASERLQRANKRRAAYMLLANDFVITPKDEEE